jgi:hypothetical protein
MVFFSIFTGDVEFEMDYFILAHSEKINKLGCIIFGHALLKEICEIPISE